MNLKPKFCLCCYYYWSLFFIDFETLGLGLWIFFSLHLKTFWSISIVKQRLQFGWCLINKRWYISTFRWQGLKNQFTLATIILIFWVRVSTKIFRIYMEICRPQVSAMFCTEGFKICLNREIWALSLFLDPLKNEINF